MTLLQALLLAALQGVSELFPVSSLGHTILVPALLHWTNIHRSDPAFLAFVVVLHLGTALALLVFYRREWFVLARSLIGTIVRGRIGDEPNERIIWLLVVATVPVGLLGVALKDPVRQFFASASTAAIFLTINGVVMFVGEHLRARQHATLSREEKPLQKLTWAQSVFVGFGQALALLPGISRSGASMVAGLLCDLDHADAARYSFLLATPVIMAAALLEIPDLWAPGAHVVALQAALGGVVAGITAYLSVAFLTRYFRTNDLRPFGWYCIVFGGLCFLLARMGMLS